MTRRTSFKRSPPLTMYVAVVCYLTPWVSGVKNITHGVARHLRSIGFPEGSGAGVKYRDKSFIFHRLMLLSIDDPATATPSFLFRRIKILNKSKMGWNWNKYSYVSCRYSSPLECPSTFPTNRCYSLCISKRITCSQVSGAPIIIGTSRVVSKNGVWIDGWLTIFLLANWKGKNELNVRSEIRLN